jgi:hypothetical protein
MIDEKELAAALNRATNEDFHHISLSNKELCRLLQEISARYLLWTYHEDSAFKFRVERLRWKDSNYVIPPPTSLTEL